MKKPILLTKYDLLVPFNHAIKRIELIRRRKANNEDSIILEGLFVLANATFENSIFDTLRILFKHIPDKIDIKDEKISKDVLISGNPLEQTIERRINSLAYGNLKDILIYFIKKTGIPEKNILSEYYEKLCEMKASRNLLLHNNLIVNSIYLESAGKYKRSNLLDEKLEISQEYLYKSIILMKGILSQFKDELEKKYNKFTSINATRNLFNFIFSTPLMNFENEFYVDEITDKIVSYNKNNSKYADLSHSEKIYFDIWIAHLEGNKIKLESNFYTIGDKNKLSYFLTAIDIIIR